LQAFSFFLQKVSSGYLSFSRWENAQSDPLVDKMTSFVLSLLPGHIVFFDESGT